VDAGGVDDDIDMAGAVTTSTGMSTGEQLTNTEGRGASFPPSSTSLPGSPDISKCSVSATSKGDDCIDGIAEGVDCGGEASVGQKKDSGDSLERDGEEGGSNGARLDYRELDTSVRVKIADLGNACWVVSLNKGCCCCCCFANCTKSLFIVVIILVLLLCTAAVTSTITVATKLMHATSFKCYYCYCCYYYYCYYYCYYCCRCSLFC